MDKQPLHHEFKVVFEGIQLDPETVDRLNRAIQKIVLQEIANLDRHGDLAVQIPLAKIGNGGTNGIWARVITSEQAQGADIERPTESQ